MLCWKDLVCVLPIPKVHSLEMSAFYFAGLTDSVVAKAKSPQASLKDLVRFSVAVVHSRVEFLQTARHCISDLEMEDLPPSPLVRCFTVSARQRYAMMEGKGVGTVAVPVLLQMDRTLLSGLPVSHVETTLVRAWGPTVCTDAPVLTFSQKLSSGRVPERLSIAHETIIWQNEREHEGAELNVNQIQSFDKSYLDNYRKNKCFSNRRVFIVIVINGVEKRIKIKTLACFFLHKNHSVFLKNIHAISFSIFSNMKRTAS